MAPINDDLQKIENRMSEMANIWLKQKAGNPSGIFNPIFADGPFGISTLCKCDEAIGSIERRLANNKRMARSNHPRYDVNQHIHLKSEIGRLKLLRKELAEK